MSIDRLGPFGSLQSWVLVLVGALAVSLLPLSGAAFAQQPSDPSDACPEDPEPAPFTDRDEIPAAHVRNVDCAYERNIVLGFADNTYRPSLSVRRDQMASFIARTIDEAGFDLPPAQAHPGFADTAGNTHEDNIRRLAAAGIVMGGPGDMPRTHYGPGLSVRRDQMASFLIRSAEYTTEAELASDQQQFPDVPPGNPHFENVNGAREQNLAAGRTDGTFGPADPTRRDQMASFLVRLLHFMETFEEPAEPTPDPTPVPTQDVTPAATPEPATATSHTDAPELTGVSAVAGATVATVTFTFDEVIDTPTITPARFFLYGLNTTGQRFVAQSAVISGSTNVVATFTREQYDQATTAAVAHDAVRDAGGNGNPERGLGLKSVTQGGATFPAGDVFGPRLVFARRASGQAPGSTAVTWVFDQNLASTIGPGQLVLYQADGTRIVQPGGFPSGGFGQCAVSGREITCTGLFSSQPVLAAVEHNTVRNATGAQFPNYEQARFLTPT